MEESSRFRLGMRDTFRIVWPYAWGQFKEQIKSIWFIVAYLIAFQMFILGLPLVFAGTIAFGILVVALGLMFFMEGLRLGLMPLGEVIGTSLPERSGLPLILTFAFLLGLGATFAEPAIAVLKAAGSGVVPEQAPLLYSLLNDFSGELVASVGIGVGIAVLLGVLRFFFNWPLKWLAIPSVTTLVVISGYFATIPELEGVLGLAWDCGAVTTGPVTVPLVLALGIGVCRVVNTGNGAGTSSGFGIVTLASLFPILAVLLLGFYHYVQDDYYGGSNYTGPVIEAQADTPAEPSNVPQLTSHITQEEYRAFAETGVLPPGFELRFDAAAAEFKDGTIELNQPTMTVIKPGTSNAAFHEDMWNKEVSLFDQWLTSVADSVRAILPLCVFLLVVLYVVLRRKLENLTDVTLGIAFGLIGMALFGLGISLGLSPLGGQLGGNIPLAFSSGVPWGLDYSVPALFSTDLGKAIAIAFAFFLGYGATLAEPALNALGDTVERITVGAFRKRLLMQAVAVGVGFGIAAGVVKMAFDLPLLSLLAPAYGLVVVLTLLAPNSFVNFSWDSAGVTTGPITVPLVLAMGLGIGGNLPSVTDGFGILALASAGPILTVLSVGLYTQRLARAEEDSASQQATLQPVEQA